MKTNETREVVKAIRCQAYDVNLKQCHRPAKRDRLIYHGVYSYFDEGRPQCVRVYLCGKCGHGLRDHPKAGTKRGAK